MAESYPSSCPTYEPGEESTIRGNELPGGTSLQMKRTRWGTTPFPIPTATLSLDEESTLQASRQHDTPSSIMSPTGQVPLSSQGM